jgi:hypothetical protein
MKKILLLLMLLIGITACTPSTDDGVLPTRVILPTDAIAVAENATEAVIDPLEGVATDSVVDPIEGVATDFVVDPLEGVPTDSVVDPLEGVATDFVVDPLEGVATDFVVDPIEGVATDFVVDPLEGVATDFVVDPLPIVPTNTSAPIVIPAIQTQPPTPTASNGITVVMPTFDMNNLPTSVPTPTPYPLVQDFANLTEGTQVVRLTGTVEIFIEPAREDDIVLLRDVNNVGIELIWDSATIDYIPGRGQIIEAIGTIRVTKSGQSPLQLVTISIIPLTELDELGF